MKYEIFAIVMIAGLLAMTHLYHHQWTQETDAETKKELPHTAGFLTVMILMLFAVYIDGFRTAVTDPAQGHGLQQVMSISISVFLLMGICEAGLPILNRQTWAIRWGLV